MRVSLDIWSILAILITVVGFAGGIVYERIG